MRALADRSLDPRRVFWLGAGAVVTVAAAVAIIAVVRGRFGETDGKILFTLLFALVCGSTALAAVALLERGQARSLAWMTLAGSPLALGLLLAYVWTWVDEQANDLANPAWTAFLGILAALASTTSRLLVASPPVVRTAWSTVVVCSFGAAAITSGLIWTNGGHGNLGRLAAALAILGGAAYLLGPIAEHTRDAARKRAKNGPTPA